jgi:predicted dehydrogenase
LQRRLGIIMNGATGRMGRSQHLMASVVAIRNEGGLPLADGSFLIPDPILVGRDESKLRAVAAEAGIERWTTSLDEALADPDYSIYFDAVSPNVRGGNVRRALEAGKHVFTEKPLVMSLEEGLSLLTLARKAGVKHAVVCDKLWTPGISKLRSLVQSGFFGQILMVRIEGCHWAFQGKTEPLQRPSWNYKKALGGGIIFDMMPHYAYILKAIAGHPLDVVAHADTLVKTRWDEAGQPYDVDVEDSVFAISRLPNGAMAHATCSWALRVRRDDVLVVQVDGTEGSAVAGLTQCRTQSMENTTRAQWSRDGAATLDYYRDWQLVPDDGPYPNPYRVQWEQFLRHVAEDAPFPWDMEAGVQTLQYADGCRESWRKRRWVDFPPVMQG